MYRSAPRLVLTAFALVLLSRGPAAAQTATFQQTLLGPPSASFGLNAAVDGTTAVVGALSEGSSHGAAYVYVRSGTTWSLQQRLEADEAGAVRFGQAVAISGNTIVVGANRTTNGGASALGAAYVFVRSGTTWTQQAKLVASDATSEHQFGVAVDIDVNTVVVGASNAQRGASRPGAAYVFERTGTAWTERRILAPTAGEGGDLFGASVGVDGEVVCVGAYGDRVGTNNLQGSAYVFAGAGAWNLQQQVTAAGGATDDWFGISCAVSGETVAVGARQADVNGAANAGAVYVFTRSGTTWTQQQRLSSEIAAANMFPVDLAGDLLVAGAIGEQSGEGALYLFRRSGATWTQSQRIGNAGQALGRSFGSGASTDGATVLGGAPTASTSGGGPGAAVAVFAFGQTGAPGAPTSFAATVAGNTVNMSWNAPVSGGAPTGYTLIARAPGGALLVTVPLGNVTSFAASAPNGTYVLSMAATNAAGTGPESAPVTVVLPASVAPPGTPSGLAVSVSGTTAVFTWNPPSTGGAVTNYLLVAGTTPGFAVPLASITLPGTPGVSIPGVPTGRFYARVLALNNGGTSAASNEVTLTVGTVSAPGAPTLNPAAVAGNTVNLSWTAGAGAATSFTLRAFAPSGLLLVSVPGLTGSSVGFSGVPSGTYELELLAVNAAGVSLPSNRITMTVP